MMKRILRYIGELFLALIVVAPIYHVWHLSKIKKEFRLYIDNYTIEKDTTTFFIEIENTGNQPLLKSDFSTDLAFNTGSLELTDIKIFSSTPTNLHIDFAKVYKNEIKLTSELYNPKDKFTISLKSYGQLDTLFVDARIIGVDEIELDINDKIQIKPTIIFRDLESNKKLRIIKATYGFANKFIDVTENLNNDIRNNSLVARASFEPDPYPNKEKYLKIKYLYSGFIDSVSIIEGHSIKLPRYQSHYINMN